MNLGRLSPESNPVQTTTTLGLPGEIALCLVCSDRGSGYHYSVYSCEGCKGRSLSILVDTVARGCMGTLVLFQISRPKFCKFSTQYKIADTSVLNRFQNLKSIIGKDFDLIIDFKSILRENLLSKE